MQVNKQKIDNLIHEILSEEIDKKAKFMVKKISEGIKEMYKNESETEEGNAFTNMLRKTKKGDKFKLGGKVYTDTSDIDEAETEEGNAFTDKLRKTKKGEKFKIGDKTYTDTSNLDESKTCPICGMKNCKCKDKKHKVKVSESELIDLIESLVLEQQKTKDNIKKTQPKGLKETEKAQKKSKSENTSSTSETSKKMKEYLKNGSEGTYEESPKKFPKSNNDLKKSKKKAYTPSEAVDEYIENFAHAAGMENLNYDEIKPNQDWVDNNIKGSSKTGNNPEWANAEETELGEKLVKKKDKNLYGLEKKKGSYKRVTIPVDEAGDGEGESKLDNMFKKLESTEEKKSQKLNEELEKIKNLYYYNQKTQ